MNINDAERWAEYESEKAAVEQEAFETFCYENDVHPDSKAARDGWAAEKEQIRYEEEKAAYEDRQIEEYEMRMRDIEEERDLLWE